MGQAAGAPSAFLKSETGAPMRVLIVEDDYLIAIGLESVLRDWGCKVVGPALDMAQGLALAETEGLDGALIDFRLHDEDTRPITRRLKSRQVPFVLVTGYDRTEIPPCLADAPMLQKPAAEAELREALKAFRRP